MQVHQVYIANALVYKAASLVQPGSPSDSFMAQATTVWTCLFDASQTEWLGTIQPLKKRYMQMATVCSAYRTGALACKGASASSEGLRLCTPGKQPRSSSLYMEVPNTSTQKPTT